MSDLAEARERTNKPILAKGLNVDLSEATRLGADFVLTYDVELASKEPVTAWLEIHEPNEIPSHDKLPMVVLANNRDILNGRIRHGAAERVRRAIGKDALVCAASGYDDFRTIPPEFDFGLIGTSMLKKLKIG